MIAVELKATDMRREGYHKIITLTSGQKQISFLRGKDNIHLSDEKLIICFSDIKKPVKFLKSGKLIKGPTPEEIFKEFNLKPFEFQPPESKSYQNKSYQNNRSHQHNRPHQNKPHQNFKKDQHKKKGGGQWSGHGQQHGQYTPPKKPVALPLDRRIDNCIFEMQRIIEKLPESLDVKPLQSAIFFLREADKLMKKSPNDSMMVATKPKLNFFQSEAWHGQRLRKR